MESLYDTVAYSNEALYLVIQETLSVLMFVMTMHKFLLNCELTNTMYCQAPEETMFISVMPTGICNAIYPEIILLQMLNLSGIYMYFLVTFYFAVVNHTSCITWSLKPGGDYCCELVVQIPLFPCSQGNLVQ